METIVKTSVLLLTALAKNAVQIESFVKEYILKHKGILPVWANKDNTLNGFYLPINNYIKLNASLLTELPMLAFDETFGKFRFHSFTLSDDSSSYRVTLSINKDGKFGCSLIAVKTDKLELNVNKMNESEQYQTIVIE